MKYKTVAFLANNNKVMALLVVTRGGTHAKRTRRETIFKRNPSPRTGARFTTARSISLLPTTTYVLFAATYGRKSESGRARQWPQTVLRASLFERNRPRCKARFRAPLVPRLNIVFPVARYGCLYRESYF